MNPLAKSFAGGWGDYAGVGGRLTFYQGSLGGNGWPYQWFQSSSSLVVGEWSHVVVTRDAGVVDVVCQWCG